MSNQVAKRLIAALTATMMMSGAYAIPMLDFLIDGNTFDSPFSITNSSTSGEFVTRFQLDLSGVPGAPCYDTVDDGPCNFSGGAVPFTPVGGTDATTGLIGPVVVADGATLLDILFADFDAGETFNWDIDIDFASPGSFTVFGDDLIGAMAIIDFSDGQRLTGSLEAVIGNDDASQFTVTGIGPTPSVPEPSSLLLLALGLAGIGYARKKQ